MLTRIHVPSLGRLAAIADALMLLVTPYFTFPGESPQLTHMWNYLKLDAAVIERLDQAAMMRCKGIPGEKPYSWWNKAFHMPRFGGWRNYVVLEPMEPAEEWYVGWVVNGKAYASRIPISGRVRMLIGPGDISFFAVRASNFAQLRLDEFDRGVIGITEPYRKTPLH